MLILGISGMWATLQDGVYSLHANYEASASHARGYIVYHSSYSVPVLADIQWSNYSGNGVTRASCGDGQYWYVKTYNGKTYFYNIGAGKFLGPKTGSNESVASLVNEATGLYYDEPATGYTRIKSAQSDAWFLGACCGWSKGQNVRWLASTEGASQYMTYTLLADGMTTYAAQIAVADKLIDPSYDVLADASSTENNTAVIFPQTAKPGPAGLRRDGSSEVYYKLYNSLFCAKFKKTATALTFEGCTQMDLKSSSNLFTVSLGNGTTRIGSSEMTLGDVTEVDLPGDASATVASEKLPGKMLQAVFTYDDKLQITWQAILRDGSHYLRTNIDVQNTSGENIDMYNIIPMIYNVDIVAAGSVPARSGDERLRGPVLTSDKIFAGVETPTAFNTIEESALSVWTPTAWTSSYFSWTPGAEIPAGIFALSTNYNPANIFGKRGYVYFSATEGHSVTFKYTGGSHKLNIVGVDLVNPNTGEVVYKDYHYGRTGGSHANNTYTLKASDNTTNIVAGLYVMRYFVTTYADDDPNETITSSGTITITGTYANPSEVEAVRAYPTTDRVVYDSGTGKVTEYISQVQIKGEWVRDTDLEAGTTWNVSSVIGLIAPNQARRSFLCYSERERAVPWHPMNNYNTWFELNIDRNNDQYYATNMNVDQCVDVVSQWKKNLYDKYGVAPQAFVMDDGWDHYGDWTFSPNFPDGFTPIDNITRQMNCGVGAWLGPVGGYGTSGNYRRAMWGGTIQLDNKEYYQTFLTAIKKMVNSKENDGYGYDFRFFKFDGIGNGAQATVYGPNSNENVEGILNIERYARSVRPDIFINSTVGTWASPFWFHFTDAIWKQDQDFGQAGSSSNSREKWITYRDNWVYDYFVTLAPLCPINTIMTHGFLLTTHSTPGGWNRDYASVKRELRCAYACGSSMVELYADYPLLNSIEDGKLWGDIADCMMWQKRNSDVLPDIHWVGGDPWDGSSHHVYGWAGWNGNLNKAVLTLRNGSDSEQEFTFTLRDVLDIPSYVSSTIQLHRSFADQAALENITEDTDISIDESITVTLPANSVYMFDGATATGVKDVVSSTDAIANRAVYSIQCGNTGVRGVMYSKNGSLERTIAQNPVVAVDPTESTQQWAILKSKKYEDTYYIVNVASGKFLTTESTMTLVAAAAENTRFRFTYGNSGSSTHPWNIWNYTKTERMNIGSSGVVMRTKNSASDDDGNRYELAAVIGVGFDVTNAETSIYAYEYGLSTAADLDNDKLYNLVNARGVVHYDSNNADYVCGSNKVSVTANAALETQQFAILTSDKGNLYFYCPSAKKFMYWDGNDLKLSDLPKSSDASIENRPGISGYTWVIKPNGTAKMMAMSTSGTKGIFGHNPSSPDEGDYWKIVPATSWNSDAVMELINQYENMPATGKFYRLRGGYSYKYAQGTNVEKTSGAYRLSMTDDKGMASLFYLTEDNKLLCFSDGFYVNNTCEKATTVGTGNSITLSARGLADTNRLRTAALKLTNGDNGNVVMYDNGRNTVPCVDRQAADAKNINWYVEEVDEIPVTFNSSALGYATFCCPVALKVPAGVEAYVCKLDIDKNTIKLYQADQIKDGDDCVLPAGTPVLLYNKDFSTDDTKLFTVASATDEYEHNGFIGTVAAETPDDGNYLYYALRKKSGSMGFYQRSDQTAALTGFRAWIAVPKTSGARNFTIEFDGDSDPTGIVEALGLENDNVEIYDLNGRKLSSYQNGINIVNGKKVFK